ncbi:hypothetical protein HYS93_00825 [Candidatus Daviesbacteria bacterium]|nr:hypothetical protein [Candidatus Daviesbacteria bacterium]
MSVVENLSNLGKELVDWCRDARVYHEVLRDGRQDYALNVWAIKTLDPTLIPVADLLAREQVLLDNPDLTAKMDSIRRPVVLLPKAIRLVLALADYTVIDWTRFIFSDDQYSRIEF